jgi:hypothetical protein
MVKRRKGTNKELDNLDLMSRVSHISVYVVLQKRKMTVILEKYTTLPRLDVDTNSIDIYANVVQ